MYPFLKELGSPHTIKFEITHGDVLSDSKNTGKSHKTLVGGIVSAIIKENKFLKEDILLVAQLTDTDGVFIDEEKVVIDSAVEGMEYRDFEIAVHNRGKYEDIITRNKLKSAKSQSLSGYSICFTLPSLIKCTTFHVIWIMSFMASNSSKRKTR